MIKPTNIGYRITLKGLLALHLPKEKANELHKEIELYCRLNVRGIAINENNELDFVKMIKMEDEKW
jgi:hypothetical protein